jgi:putative flippase GtrA
MPIQLIKYGMVTLLNYLIVFSGTYVLTEKIGMVPNLSYLYMVSLAYGIQYILNTRYVFSVRFTKKSALMYLYFLIFFWLFNNIVYNFLIEFFKIQYLIAVGINIIFFGLLRFFLQKRYVFNH